MRKATARRLAALLLALTAGPLAAAELEGRLDWAGRVWLGVPVTGVVARVAVAPGDRVEAGQELLRLDDAAARADVAAARAGLRAAEARLEEARREFERAEELYDRTVASEHERVVARNALREAEAGVARARAGLARARQRLGWHHLKAPFAARVLAVAAVPGQAVVAALRAPRLVELADGTRLRVRVRGDAPALRALLDAEAVHVVLDGRELPAKDVRPLHGDEGGEAVEVLLRAPGTLDAVPGTVVRVRW